MPEFRQHFLRIKNRLEELAAKLGPLAISEPPSAVLDPTWGKLGSLAQAQMPEEEFKQLLALHRDAIRLERQQDEPLPRAPRKLENPPVKTGEPRGADW